MKIAVLLSCHNRREKTLMCLQMLFANRLPQSLTLHVILVDDGSSDGTSESVRATYPDVEIVKGDGTLFWNRGMHLAFSIAMSKGFDAYLWLNDDTFLFDDAIDRLFTYWQKDKSDSMHSNNLYVGSTRDVESEITTYGGLKRHGPIKRFRFDLVEPSVNMIACDTMNGNCVLVPDNVARKLGNLDPVFEHAMGDIDYGLRAHKLGCKILLLPGYFGFCSKDELCSLPEAESGRLVRLKWLLGQKALPPKSWMSLVRRHGGILWPLYWIQPYLWALIKRH